MFLKLTQENKLLPTKIFAIAGLDESAIDRKSLFGCSYQGDGILIKKN